MEKNREAINTHDLSSGNVFFKVFLICIFLIFYHAQYYFYNLTAEKIDKISMCINNTLFV